MGTFDVSFAELVAGGLQIAGQHPALAAALAIGLSLPLLAVATWFVRTLVAAVMRPRGALLRDAQNEPSFGAPVGRPMTANLEIQSLVPAQRIPLGLAPLRLAEQLAELISRTGRTGSRNDSDDASSGEADAVISMDPDLGYVLRDLSPAGVEGVRVNGTRVATCLLADGDRIDVGTTRLLFRGVPVGAPTT